jgi:hypothetical protein
MKLVCLLCSDFLFVLEVCVPLLNKDREKLIKLTVQDFGADYRKHQSTVYPYRIFLGETTKFSRGIAEGSRKPGHILRTFLFYERNIK